LSEKSRNSWLWSSLAWCVGILGMTGIWVSTSLWLDSACLWMTMLAVVDIALILRFTGVDAGWPKFVGILSGTIMTAWLSQWLIAANAFGLAMGLLPTDAAQMVGSVLVMEFTRLRISETEFLYPVIAMLLAWFFGLHGRK
jgi:hypothetical protein